MGWIEDPGLQTPSLPKPGPSPLWASAPLLPSWAGSFPESLSSSSFLWVDGGRGRGSLLIQGCAGHSSWGFSSPDKLVVCQACLSVLLPGCQLGACPFQEQSWGEEQA